MVGGLCFPGAQLSAPFSSPDYYNVMLMPSNFCGVDLIVTKLPHANDSLLTQTLLYPKIDPEPNCRACTRTHVAFTTASQTRQGLTTTT